MVCCGDKQGVQDMKRPRRKKTDDQVCETWKVLRGAQALGVSEKSMRKLIDEGNVPYLRVGRLILLPRQAFLAWINGQHGSDRAEG